MSKLVAAMIDGELSIHAPGATSDYDTLCGLDLHDEALGSVTAKLPARAKIDCEQCHAIWASVKGLRASDFASAF